MAPNDQSQDSSNEAKSNYEGGEAYEPTNPKFRLYKLAVNNLLEDTFYRDEETAITEIRRGFAATVDQDGEFPLQLAYYARDEMYLREVPQLLLVLAAHHDTAKQYVRRYAPHIMQRADEPGTVLALHDSHFGGTAPKPLKKGINDALHQFDAYEFAKYDSDRSAVNLRDVVNRTHPRPRDEEHDVIFERLVRGPLDDYPDVDPLETPTTWETVISERGATRDAWRDVLLRMGLLARLRNLRNMLQAGVPGHAIFSDDDLEQVRDAKLYPFRFYQAYRAVQEAGVATPEIEAWLSEAVEVALDAVPEEFASTFVAVDLSGSMESPLSPNSALTYAEIAAFFGAVLVRRGATAGVFATDFEIGSSALAGTGSDPNTFELTERLRSKDVGHSTNGWKAIDFLVEERLAPDRVILLTDMQLWDSEPGPRDHSVRQSFDTYRETIDSATDLYMVDLSSYGDLATPEGYTDVYNISGWNDRLLDFIDHAERPTEVLESIENVSVPSE